MSRRVDEKEAASLLRNMRDVAILTHRRPDGDTLGSGFALFEALRLIGVRAQVLCTDPFPGKYEFLTRHYEECREEFEPSSVVAVDMAAISMAGRYRELAERTLLCIDHHGTNEAYAENLLLRDSAAACCEIMLRVIKELGLPLNPYMADALYTGVATDTGCFMFRNVTEATHRAAAETIAAGASIAEINQNMFEQRSRGRVALELLLLENMEFFFGGRVAFTVLTMEALQKTGAKEDDIEGINGLARSIEGVEVGITMRETAEGWKGSLRSHSVNSAAIAGVFGGGGHPGAAGFECSGSLADIKALLLHETEKAL